jgi:hypothetical protein
MAVGTVALVPAMCLLARTYFRWCTRLIRPFLADPEPITLDSGWPSDAISSW